MKLFELTRPQRHYEIDTLLSNAGYQGLGRGFHGSVYQKPGAKYVLKVFATHDHCYYEFLKVARAHQDNPHMPRPIGKLVWINDAFVAVRLEPLKPGHLPFPLYDFITSYYAALDANRPDRAKFVIEHGAEWTHKYPKMVEALDLIYSTRQAPRARGCMDDFKDANIMFRGETPVFTDPLA
jgi:hypothetical protein